MSELEEEDANTRQEATNTPAGPPAPITDAPESPTIPSLLNDQAADPPAPNGHKLPVTVLNFFRSPSAVSLYGDVIQTSLIAQVMGTAVYGVTTSKEYDLAVKMRGHLHPSERDMADFAARSTNRLLTGRMYEVHRDLRIMVGDRVAGETVAKVWQRLSGKELRAFKKDITPQLAAHVARMRTFRKPFIGRVGPNDEDPPQETRNFYDGPVGGFFGPFTGPDPEAEFDEWALGQLSDPKQQDKWRKRLEKDRQKRGSPRSFVLTHADLTWNNVMVAKDSTTGKYVITGIIDWDRSGFLPDYVERCVLRVISYHEKGWLEILRAVVPKGNSRTRLQFTRVLQSACNPMVSGW